MWVDGEYLNKSAAINEKNKREKEVVLWYDVSNIRGRNINYRREETNEKE